MKLWIVEYTYTGYNDDKGYTVVETEERAQEVASEMGLDTGVRVLEVTVGIIRTRVKPEITWVESLAE